MKVGDASQLLRGTKIAELCLSGKVKNCKFRLANSPNSSFNLDAKMKTQDQVINAIYRFSFAASASGDLPDF